MVLPTPRPRRSPSPVPGASSSARVARVRVRNSATTLLAMVTVALASVLVAASPAQAATASVAVRGGVLYEGCHDHAYSYAVDPFLASGGWSITVEVRDPRGVYSTGDVIGSFEGDPTSGTADGLVICGSEDPGRWQLTATVDYYDFGSEDLPSATFVMRRPATSVGLRVDDRTARVGQVLRFSGSVRGEYSTGRFGLAYDTVRLQKRVGSSWRTVARTTTDGAGRYRMSVRWRDARARSVRVVATPDSPFATGVSAALRIR